MKKQSGFTLIELMVVMAIIAILATAGLSAYTGYIKKARDTTRIADINAINTIVLGMLSSTGSTPTTAAAVTIAVTAANNGVVLADPLEDRASCLNTTSGTSLAECGYWYAQCDDGAGFAVGTMFESTSNQAMYALDAVGNVAALANAGGLATMPTDNSTTTTTGGTAGASDGLYTVGSCKSYCLAANCGVPYFSPI